VSDPARYAIRIKASAEQDMASLPSNLLRRLANAILLLESTPRPRTSKRLRGRAGYRIRVGDYRIVYIVDDASRVVEVVAVGHRKDVYRR
jgi:mRNA interferase RelE/StbE